MQRITSRDAQVGRLALALSFTAFGASGLVAHSAGAQDLPPAPPAADAVPKTGQATEKPDAELAMTAGELRLDGKITAITGPGTFIIEATSFTSPAGKQKEFDEPKSKKITVPDAATLRGIEGPRRFKFSDLKLNEPVAIIGKSAPDGSLQSRIIVLLDSNKFKTVKTVMVSPAVAVLGNAGMEAFRRGQMEHAVQLLKQAIDIAVAAGDKPGQVVNLGNLSIVLMTVGQPQAALQLINRGLPISREIDDQGQTALMYSHLASAQGMLKRAEEARQSLENGLGAARGANDPKILRILLVNLADSLSSNRKDAGALTRALGLYEEALPLARNENDDAQVADILVSSAILRAVQGDAEKARELGTQVQTMVGNLTDNAERGGILEALGVLYSQEAVKDGELSKGFWNKALEAFNAVGSLAAAERVQRRLNGQLKGLGDEDDNPKPQGGDDGGGLMDG